MNITIPSAPYSHCDIELNGSSGEFAQSLQGFDINSSRNLLRATGFITRLLCEKQKIAVHLDRKIEDVVINGAQLAVNFLRGQPANAENPVLRAFEMCDPAEQHTAIDYISRRSLEKLDVYRITSYLQLVKERTNKGFLFMPLANGGIPAGLLAHPVIADTLDPDAILYPVHFSIQKAGHLRPFLYPTEYEFLSEIAKEKNIVVFDDDTSTGDTMQTAMQTISHAAKVPRSDLLGMTVLCGGLAGDLAAFHLTDEGMKTEAMA